MKIISQLTNEVILRELGGRLAQTRLERNLTQAALAEQAGLAKRTVERLEAGEVAMQFSSFLRVCRVLNLLERFQTLIPEQTARPMEQLKMRGKNRKRATGRRVPEIKKKWTWGKSE